MSEDLLELTRGLRLRLSDSSDLEFLTAAPRASGPVSSPESLSAISAEIAACRRCPLGSTRLKAVPGVGSEKAAVMLVGEGPGFDEDHSGEPFVGKSGQLLDRILASIGLSRSSVFIANTVKCHPMKDPGAPEARGNDRPPTPEELAACRGFLDRQILSVAPKVVVTLGAVAARALLGELSLTRSRGQWRGYQPAGASRPVLVLPTYHPAALLRNPDLKRDVWTDMKALRRFLDEAQER